MKFSNKNATVVVSSGFQPAADTDNNMSGASTSLKKLLSTRANVRPAGASSKRLDSVRYGGLRLLLRGRPTTRVQVPQEVSAAPDGAIGRHQRGHLVVTVTDTGAGISKENQKLLFGEGVQFNPEKVPSPPFHRLNLCLFPHLAIRPLLIPTLISRCSCKRAAGAASGCTSARTSRSCTAGPSPCGARGRCVCGVWCGVWCGVVWCGVVWGVERGGGAH